MADDIPAVSLTPLSPAEQLTGVQLGNWIIEDRVAKSPRGTGGCFSVTYNARDVVGGRRGFAKVVDLIAKLGDPEDLRRELNNYQYEAKVLSLCASLKMDGVVVALDSGIHKVKIPAIGADVAVPYLIFEVAKGDLRTHEGAEHFNLAWRLRVFHGVCVAMNQLHRAEIAHQDMKPSNVLVFESDKAKIADLGRATIRNDPSAFSGFDHQGDNNYIPIELMYDGFHTASWTRRRLGADFFMIGCLLVYLLVDASLLTLLMERLDKRFWPTQGKHRLDTVLPHLEMAFDAVMADLKKELPAPIAEDVISMIGVLAHPNPERRGRSYLHGEKWKEIRAADPERYVREQYSLETIISRVDALAIRAKKGAALNKTAFLDFIRKP